MNFYTLTSKSTLRPQRWILLLFFSSFFISLSIFMTNVIVDPYNMTKYNILDIKYKLVRDDRRAKVNYFKTQKRVDNILIGSSRVYSINPKTASELFGGTTYNFGVGAATVEDHLGILKYLQREDKLPKNLFIGVDFYTFNPTIPADKHFLINEDINFLSSTYKTQNKFEEFFSIDALRDSIKTIKYHMKKTDKKPSFDKNGWGSFYFDYSKIDRETELMVVKNDVQLMLKKYYTNYTYLDESRISYYEEIRKICEENNINLYIFTTPLHPLVIKALQENEITNKVLKEFIKYLSTFENFYNFYEDDEFQNFDHYAGASHTKGNAGDIILRQILDANR